MKRQTIRKMRKVKIAKAVKSSPSKPVKTGLKKSDPDYFSKIGTISAQKRKMTPEQFSAMAKLSHPRPRSGYRKSLNGA